MTTFMEKYQTIIIRIIVGVGILLGLFLLATTIVKMKEYRFVGSGVNATNTITVSGIGKIDRAPDTAKITFTIQDEQKSVKVAQDNVSNKMDAVTKQLKAVGIEEKYIKTDSYNSYPQYDYPQVVCTTMSCPRPSSPVLRGYQVSHSVTVSVKNLDNVSQVLGALGDSAVTNVSGPNFGFDDDKAIAREARDLAIVDAKTEADRLAKSLGVRLVRIVSFSENGGSPMPIYATAGMMAQDKVSSAPAIPVGEQNIQSNVTLVYEIQ
jgi:uncharacterized protein YggE